MATAKLLPNRRGLPEQLAINDREVHRGGEGRIFFSDCSHYVVKIYHRPTPGKQEALQKVVDLGKHLGEDEQFLAWPLGIVHLWNDQPTLGVVTRRVPTSHVALDRLMCSHRSAWEQFIHGIKWSQYVKIARGAAAAVRTIHGKGMGHADIHFKNFLGDPSTGEVVLIDLDGLVVPGFLSAQVKGMMGFSAPEVWMGSSQPDQSTDRHSLAVLLLWILLFRNVMQSQKCYDPDDPRRDDELSYGQYACFSEHPTDRSNWIPQIGTPLFRGGALSYRVLTPALQELTERALIHGLHDPPKRPQAVEWERALAQAYDLLVRCCECHQSFFYPYWLTPPGRRRCPFCGKSVPQPLPAVLELLELRAEGVYLPVRNIVLYQGLPLFRYIVEPRCLVPFSCERTPIIGEVIWNDKEGAHRLVNHGDTAWQVISPSRATVGRGGSVALRPGMLLAFGAGKRLARVVE